jgi:hypothetical protein
MYAFPSTTHTADGHPVNGPEFGLTKREYFAGKFMAQMISEIDWSSSFVDPLRIASDAVVAAEALLDALGPASKPCQDLNLPAAQAGESSPDCPF